MFKHILVPTDGSQLSQDSARRAVVFAKETGARITAFHARRESPTSYYDEAVTIDKLMRDKYAENAERLAIQSLDFVENLCQQAGVSCTALTIDSNVPYAAIIEAATRSGCDLIFMASHGRQGISGLLLGSETNKVLTHTKIPVLVNR